MIREIVGDWLVCPNFTAICIPKFQWRKQMIVDCKIINFSEYILCISSFQSCIVQNVPFAYHDKAVLYIA